MSQTPSPENPVPASTDEHDFAAKIQLLWDKHRQQIIQACTGVILGLIAWQGWEYWQSSREANTRAEYASLGADTTKLAAFANEHDGHLLAAIARVRLADEAYGKSDFKTATSLYQQAAESLPVSNPLQGRVRIGAAISQLQAGDAAAAASALKAIADDTQALSSVRSEAAYHLAVAAKTAGKFDEARRLLDEISKIDPSSLWDQRGFALRNSLEEAAAASTPAPAAATDASPSLQLNISGK